MENENRKLNDSDKKFLKDKNSTQSILKSNELSMNFINVFSNFFSFNSETEKENKVQEEKKEDKDKDKDEEESSFFGFGSIMNKFTNFCEKKKKQLDEINIIISVLDDFIGDGASQQMIKMASSHFSPFSPGIDMKKEIKVIIDKYPEFAKESNELSDFCSGLYASYAKVAEPIIQYFHLENNIPLYKENKDLMLKVTYIGLIGNMCHLKQASLIGIAVNVLLPVIALALKVLFSIKEMFIELLDFIVDKIYAVVEFIVDLIISSAEFIFKIIAFLWENLIKVFKAIFKAIKKVWQFIKYIGKCIWEYIKEFAIKILKKMEDLVNILKNYIVKLVKMIKKCVFGLYHLILDNFSVSFCLFFVISAVAIGAMILYLRNNPEKEGLDFITCDCFCHTKVHTALCILHPAMWIPSIIGYNKFCKSELDKSHLFFLQNKCAFCQK